MNTTTIALRCNRCGLSTSTVRYRSSLSMQADELLCGPCYCRELAATLFSGRFASGAGYVFRIVGLSFSVSAATVLLLKGL